MPGLYIIMVPCRTKLRSIPSAATSCRSVATAWSWVHALAYLRCYSVEVERHNGQVGKLIGCRRACSPCAACAPLLCSVRIPGVGNTNVTPQAARDWLTMLGYRQWVVRGCADVLTIFNTFLERGRRTPPTRVPLSVSPAIGFYPPSDLSKPLLPEDAIIIFS